MATIKVFKEIVLPETLEPNALYLVAPNSNTEYVEIYVTNQAGTASRRTLNVGDVTQLINDALAGLVGGEVGMIGTGSTIEIADTYADIAELGLTENAFVYVVDATGDATVASGGASYIYNATTQTPIKIAEYESMDISLSWDKIQGRPESTSAAIDQAVQKAHSHANSTTLNALGTDGQGNLTLDGVIVGNQLSSVNW